ncbi:fungal-specific transcription factor domain protein [Aspergillus ambiguus]|uniref:putative C6 transcription factor n=1 Tax=Aspergillus ambiguus TaxID=176160 RepID=UPI003CCDC15D
MSVLFDLAHSPDYNHPCIKPPQSFLMDAEGSENGAQGPLVRRACDQCRLRKIRCDKRSPCSNCRSSQIVCRSTGAGQKPPEPRRRVLISSQYERKIDLIEERLGSIEDVLHDLRASASSKTDSPPYYPPLLSSKPMTSSASNPADTLDQHESVTTFEGSSSFTAHSAYASQFLESAVSKGHLQMSTPKMEAALSTLKQMAESVVFITSVTFTACGSRLAPITGGKPLPWMQGLPFIGVDRLIEKCREVFFATEDFSEEAFIIANGGLYFIFSECMFMEKTAGGKETYRKYIDMMRSNLQSALANLSLLMPATAETISALSLGAIYAIEISKPSFALTLTSAASHLCQTLGYHRASSMENDSEDARQDKINLFWTVYCIDKALSLRLGRAATMQDYDISVPMTISVFGSQEPWNTIYSLWIHFARMQGKVYETLYSPTALNKPEEQRDSQARKLASELQWTVIEPHKKDIDRQSLSLYDAIAVKADEVAHLSLLAMIYRAIPGQDGSSGSSINECVETARAALECHQQCMEMLKECNESHVVLIYFHWTILYSPFAPFIVLFCHVIESSSDTDLQRLEDFVASLQPNCVLSEAISKLHRLCQVLNNIAKLYLEAKARSLNQEDQTIGQEFDTYLSALGLAPAASEYGDVRPPGAPATSAPAGSMDVMHGMETPVPYVAPSTLRNWFSGNQHMMGLLEEDLSLFDPSIW